MRGVKWNGDLVDSAQGLRPRVPGLIPSSGKFKLVFPTPSSVSDLNVE